MKKNLLLTSILFTLLVISLTFPTITFQTKASTTPNLHVQPSSTTVDVGESFPINISITDVNQLAAWQLKLYYKNSILNGIFTFEGPFLKQGGSTFYWEVQLNNNYNATHGLAELICTIIGDTGGANGTGTLATIIFKSIGQGNTTLHLENTELVDASDNPIQHTTNDGNVQVIGTADIAITNVTPCKTIVGQSYTMKINVTVENQGDTTQTWNVTTYANTTLIETKEITLPSGNSTTITFTWNTTGFAKGNYTINAYSWPVPGETDISDNNFTDGWVVVTIPGDFNGDYYVEIFDIVKICIAYNTKQGDPLYKPVLDIDDDGDIDIFDVVIACVHYGQKDP